MLADVIRRHGATLAIVAAGTVLLVYVALTWQVNADEGLYLYGSQSVARGEMPYRGFVFPQLPYVLFPYMLAGRSLVAARLISVLFGVVSLVVFARLVGTRGLAALALLAANNLFVWWTPMLKQYAMCGALALAAFWLVQDPRPRRLFLGGLVLGVLLGTRLLYAPLLPIYLAWLAFPKEDRGKRLKFFAAGIAVALVPCALIFALAPGDFLFSVIGIQAMRSGDGAVGRLDQKLAVALHLLTRPQPLVLIGLAALGFYRERSRMAWLALGCAGSLAVMSLLPTPAYWEYFVAVMPFLALLAVPALDLLLRRRWWIVGGLACLLVYACAHLYEFDRHQESGFFAKGKLDEIHRVADAIRERAAPGDTVLSFWSGYNALSGTRTPPGLENYFVYAYRSRMTVEKKRRHSVPEHEDLERWIHEGRYRTVALTEWIMPETEYQALVAAALAAGYRVVYKGTVTTVYERG